MTKNLVIVALLAALVWFGSAIVRLENYRYASAVGFCSEYPLPERQIAKQDCLAKVQTRTSPIWHLLYGLQIIGNK